MSNEKRTVKRRLAFVVPVAAGSGGSCSCFVLGRLTRLSSQPDGWWKPARRSRHPCRFSMIVNVGFSVAAHNSCMRAKIVGRVLVVSA